MDTRHTEQSEQHPDAVVWIDERHAIVARRDRNGQISTVEVRRLARPETRFLGQVVHELAGRDHVMVIGAQPVRLALERRFVAVSHRPDRLMAPPPATLGAGAQIVKSLDQLAA
jgi:hypothetical protein